MFFRLYGELRASVFQTLKVTFLEFRSNRTTSVSQQRRFGILAFAAHPKSERKGGITLHVVVVHFHLNRGGVTQVVKNHLRALDLVASQADPLSVLILHGGETGGWSSEVTKPLTNLDVHLKAVASLAYDTVPQSDPHRLYQDLRSVIDARGWEPNQTVIHVHNHNLGKNVSLPSAIRMLADDGFGCLLQIHDFAEDFRPDNYQHLVQGLCADRPDEVPKHLYFCSDKIHLAFLNRRDHSILKEAGLPDSKAVALPNPIGGLGDLPTAEDGRRRFFEASGCDPDQLLLLYPVRGIRRKNLGEALLWSLIVREQAFVATTLAPGNPIERRSYRRWKSLARELNLPLVFETSALKNLSYLDAVAASDAVLSTSIAEGFGLAFLESWTAGKPMIGRDLPEITEDFKAEGVDLAGLYSRLPIPLEWVDIDAVVDSIRDAYRGIRSSYRLTPLPTLETEQQIQSLIVDGQIDFALLTSELQSKVIKRLNKDPDLVLQIQGPVVRQLSGLESGDGFSGVAGIEKRIESNRQVILENYSLQQTGKKLWQTYQRLIESGGQDRVSELEHGEIVLRRFLQIDRMHPIRFE